MADRTNQFAKLFWQSLIGAIKFKLLLVTVFSGMILYGIALDYLDPTVAPVDSPERAAAIQAEIAAARRDGRIPDLVQFEPFDNYALTSYLVPLFGIWMLSRFAAWRRLLPMAVVGTIGALFMGLWLAVPAGQALMDLYESWSGEGFMSDRNRIRAWALGVMLALAVPILAFRWLRRGPGWLDRIMRGAGGSPEARAPRVRLWLYASSLAIAPVLWIIYDGFDGGRIPGPFALGVRALFVVLAIWLVARPQVALAWPPRPKPKKEPPQPQAFETVTFT